MLGTTGLSMWFSGLMESSKERARWVPKGKVSVRRAILSVWGKLPETFGSNLVIRLVEKETGAHFMDTTIMAWMRRLRNKGKIKYECISRQDSIYRKLH